jgi:hypothetical protein
MTKEPKTKKTNHRMDSRFEIVQKDIRRNNRKCGAGGVAGNTKNHCGGSQMDFNKGVHPK